MPKSKLLYHITHINNLESIFRQDSLLPHAHIKKCIINYIDVANQDIQSRRERTIIPVGAGGYLHDYVPFYFAPRSPIVVCTKNATNSSR